MMIISISLLYETLVRNAHQNDLETVLSTRQSKIQNEFKLIEIVKRLRAGNPHNFTRDSL